MTNLFDLWLPILVSAVAVFLTCAMIYTMSPWHWGDYQKLPQETQVLDALSPLGIPPGDYAVPRHSTRMELRSPGFAEKLKRGPVMVVTVMPNGFVSIGRNMMLAFVYNFIVSIFAAYVAGLALPHSAPTSQIIHFTGVTAFLGYSLALWQMSIWYRRAWSTTIKLTIDGVIFAVITAAIFAWLWPKG